MGQVLQLEIDMGTLPLREVAQVAAGVCIDFKTLPADVCEYRDCHRQRACKPFDTLGAFDGQAVSHALRRPADAGLRLAYRVTSGCSETLRRFPSASLNQATLAPVGVVQTPSWSCAMSG